MRRTLPGGGGESRERARQCLGDPGSLGIRGRLGAPDDRGRLGVPEARVCRPRVLLAWRNRAPGFGGPDSLNQSQKEVSIGEGRVSRPAEKGPKRRGKIRKITIPFSSSRLTSGLKPRPAAAVCLAAI